MPKNGDRSTTPSPDRQEGQRGRSERRDGSRPPSREPLERRQSRAASERARTSTSHQDSRSPCPSEYEPAPMNQSQKKTEHPSTKFDRQTVGLVEMGLLHPDGTAQTVIEALPARIEGERSENWQRALATLRNNYQYFSRNSSNNIITNFTQNLFALERNGNRNARDLATVALFIENHLRAAVAPDVTDRERAEHDSHIQSALELIGRRASNNQTRGNVTRLYQNIGLARRAGEEVRTQESETEVTRTGPIPQGGILNSINWGLPSTDIDNAFMEPDYFPPGLFDRHTEE